MKGADSYMEIILMVFPKKSCLGLIGHLKPKMAHPHNPWVRCRDCVTLLRYEKG